MADHRLFKFLMENECHLYKDKDGIKAWVAVDFSGLSDFVKIAGEHHFDCGCGGLNVTMFDDYIAVELLDIIEGSGEELIDYKECFDSDERDDYFPKE